MKSENWREAAYMAGRWCRRMEDGVEAVIRRLYDMGRSPAAEGPTEVATATRAVSANIRGGVEGK